MCVCCLCVLFKMPPCYWHSRDSHSTAIPATCTRTCVRAEGLFFLHQQKAGLHLFPVLTPGQLFNTKYLFSAKTLFLYECSLTSCLSPNQSSLISALFIQKRVATHACLTPDPPCSILASQCPHQSVGHQDQPDVTPAYQCRCLAA